MKFHQLGILHVQLYTILAYGMCITQEYYLLENLNLWNFDT
jgi:hypothetical protein